MSKVLIIGVGGVGTVVCHKVAQHTDIFTDIVIASRTQSKCDAVAKVLKEKYGVSVTTDKVDADYTEQIVALFKKHQPELVINVALPYQDLNIMDACLDGQVPEGLPGHGVLGEVAAAGEDGVVVCDEHALSLSAFQDAAEIHEGAD